MSDTIDLLEKLLLEDDGLLISLRMGDGLDKGKADQVCKVLIDISKEWEGLDDVPKKAVGLFIDLYPAMQSSCESYSEEEAMEIMDYADRIVSLVKTCIF